jgi:hypothetical protein
MNWLKKIAAKRYMWHGTSIKNLSSILSEGLNFHSKRQNWTEDSTRDESTSYSPQSRGSFPGIYLTNNVGTARGSGMRANQFKQLVSRSPIVIVGVQIEDRTPSIILDEDKIPSPQSTFNQIYHVNGGGYFYGGWLKESKGEAEQVARQWLSRILGDYLPVSKEPTKRIEWLLPYAIPVVIACAEVYYADEYRRTDMKSNYDQYFPNVATSFSEARSKYRQVLHTFLQKIHFLVERKGQSEFNVNFKISEPISYVGANKIVFVATIYRYDINDLNYKYYETIKINYMSDPLILNDFVKDMVDRVGPELLIQDASGKIYYDHPREKNNELATKNISN